MSHVSPSLSLIHRWLPCVPDWLVGGDGGDGCHAWGGAGGAGDGGGDEGGPGD